jgi:hypothetical protein
MSIKLGLGKYLGNIYSAAIASDDKYDDSDINKEHVYSLINGDETAILTEFEHGRLVSCHGLNVVLAKLNSLSENPQSLAQYTSFEQLMMEWEFNDVSEGSSSIIVTYLEHQGFYKEIFKILSVELLSIKPS